MLLLGLTLGLAGWAVVSAVGAAISVLLWRRLPPLEPGTAARRARGLFALGLLPSALAATLVGAVLLPAFFLYEPRDASDAAGPLLALMALAGAALLGAGAWRGASEARLTRTLVRRWMLLATPLRLPGLELEAYRFDARFPVVSVVGQRRPRLFVSHRVLEACDPDELRVILAHEAAHVAARDNLRRALLSAAADPLALSPLGRRLRHEWHEAAEAAADEGAAGEDPGARLALASALVRLARLATRPEPLPGAAVLDGAPVASRVRHLLADPAPRTGSPRPAACLLTARLALGLLGLAHLEQVHAATERVIALLN